MHHAIEGMTIAALPKGCIEARSPPSTQRFFVALGLWSMVAVIVGFAPSFYRYFAGVQFIPPMVHVHGAVIFCWFALYTLQAHLAGRGDFARHRTIGWLTAGIAALVWLFLIVAVVGSLQRFDPADDAGKTAFMTNILLMQGMTTIAFPILVTVAVLVRQHGEWHKRLMAFPGFLLIQAAIDRLPLPPIDVPMFWQMGLRLYVAFLLPLFVYDIVTRRWIHPATLTGTAVVLVMHAIASAYWDSPEWAQDVLGFWTWVRD